MAEITEQENHRNNVEIVVRTIGPARPSRLQLPSSIRDRKLFCEAAKKLVWNRGHCDSLIIFFGKDDSLLRQVLDLRKLIAENYQLPLEKLRLILRGNVLHDNKSEDLYLQLKDGDSLIVAVKPNPPAKHLRDGIDDDDDDEDDLKFQLPLSSNRWKRRIYAVLHDKLKLPDILMMAIFSLSLKMWVIIIMWFVLAPVAHRWDIGPLYILATGFGIILLNLGQRKPGDVSAYSIFNEDFRELPGTLNAERLDGDIRTGQI